MYCILVTGIPAAGKTTMARKIAETFHLPVISKDRIKEYMYDEVGFESRDEKVQLGVASMDIMYYVAEQLMKCNLPFILENNFENVSQKGLNEILEKYGYQAVTVTLTGDYKKVYQRFCERDKDSSRHRGHVVNDCYPEKEPGKKPPVMTYDNYINMIMSRGMDSFMANGPRIVVDTSDYERLNSQDVIDKIEKEIEKLNEKEGTNHEEI